MIKSNYKYNKTTIHPFLLRHPMCCAMSLTAPYKFDCLSLGFLQYAYCCMHI